MSDVDWIVGRRSLTEPDLPSQSDMALDVPSLDVYVTRNYSSLFILTVLLDSGVPGPSAGSAEDKETPLFHGVHPFLNYVSVFF